MALRRLVEVSREGAQRSTESASTKLGRYSNVANPEAHYRTTGPEIWKQTAGTVTHFVASLGTCGTVSGAGRYLREQSGGKVQVLAAGRSASR